MAAGGGASAAGGGGGAAASSWPAGAATGLGSLPGTDIVEATRLVFGELPDLPHLPELPARGAGADMIGRSAALLVDLPVEICPSGWRLTTHPGRELRRARDFLARDLDALAEAADGYAGALKIQVAGPWTLACGVELPSGHRAVTDPGAVRDLAASLAEGVAAHLAEVSRRVPGAHVVAQFDEPWLPAVLAGAVPTASGYGTVRSVEAVVAEAVLREVLAVAPAGGRVAHCCAANAPIALLRAAGADAVSLDAALLTEADYDALGEAIESGMRLWLGVLPATDAAIGFGSARELIHRLWDALGFPRSSLAATVVPTPACGLAGASAGHARRALAVVRDIGRALRDESA
ncbi:MAG: methionine synthase [Actinomycetia bacterium]|nr:methionine synthase [Actinomycetes bacterium]